PNASGRPTKCSLLSSPCRPEKGAPSRPENVRRGTWPRGFSNPREERPFARRAFAGLPNGLQLAYSRAAKTRQDADARGSSPDETTREVPGPAHLVFSGLLGRNHG